MKTPLKSGYPSGYIDLAQAYNAFQSSIQQGKIQTSDTEQSRTNFIVQLNNADMSIEYIETLWKIMGEEIRGTLIMTSRGSEILESCLAGIQSIRDTLKSIVDFGLHQLRTNVIKPRIQNWVDQFISIKHELTEVRKKICFYVEYVDNMYLNFRKNYQPMRPVRRLCSR